VENTTMESYRQIFTQDIFSIINVSSTYDHRTLKTGLPVRSALLKQRTGGLVVRWVTTSEYPLLYVFAYFVVCQDTCVILVSFFLALVQS
jgi:hypothetical protein